jgi:hypothetical protein
MNLNISFYPELKNFVNMFTLYHSILFLVRALKKLP